MTILKYHYSPLPEGMSADLHAEFRREADRPARHPFGGGVLIGHFTHPFGSPLERGMSTSMVNGAVRLSPTATAPPPKSKI